MVLRRPETDLDDETWRTRSYHRRSRDGCLTCRKRHNKCDLQKPVCNACHRLRRTCRYEEQATTGSAQPAKTVVKGLLSAGRPDPFDTFAVSSEWLADGEAFPQFISCFKQFDRTLPRKRPTVIDLRPDQPMYLTGGLLWASIRLYALGSADPRLARSTWKYRVEMLKGLKDLVAKDSGTGAMLATHSAVIAGMFCLELFLEDYVAAEAHFRGVEMLARLQTGSSRRIEFRYMLIHLAFFRAAEQARARGQKTLGRDYALAASTYGLVFHDYSISYPLYNEHDSASFARLHGWLVRTLRAERERKGDGDQDGDVVDGQNGADAVAIRASSTSRVLDDMWHWKLAVTACALTIGTLEHVSEPREDGERTELSSAEKDLWELKMWMEKSVAEWRLADDVLQWPGAVEVVDKLLWLMETSEGLEVLDLIANQSSVAREGLLYAPSGDPTS